MKTKQCEGCDEQVSSRKTWCTQCIKYRKKLQNMLGQRKRQEANQKLCSECKEVYTSTKYCNPCSQKVRALKLQEYKAKAAKLCKECGIDISHRKKHAKYCEVCVDTVNERNRVERCEKDLVKYVIQKVEINPAFLVRGKITYTGYSSGL